MTFASCEPDPVLMELREIIEGLRMTFMSLMSSLLADAYKTRVQDEMVDRGRMKRRKFIGHTVRSPRSCFLLPSSMDHPELNLASHERYLQGNLIRHWHCFVTETSFEELRPDFRRENGTWALCQPIQSQPQFLNIDLINVSEPNRFTSVSEA